MSKRKIIDILIVIAISNSVFWVAKVAFILYEMRDMIVNSDSWFESYGNIIWCLPGIVCSHVPLIIAKFINESRRIN